MLAPGNRYFIHGLLGKSALLKWIAAKVAAQDPESLIIAVRGADLVRGKFGLTSQLNSANEHTHDWMVRICALINRQLARKLNLAVTDDQITLVETAELEGYKSRNLVGALLDRLQTLREKGRGVTKLHAPNEIELFRRGNAR